MARAYGLGPLRLLQDLSSLPAWPLNVFPGGAVTDVLPSTDGLRVMQTFPFPIRMRLR